MTFEDEGRRELAKLRPAGFIVAPFACDDHHVVCVRPLEDEIVLIALVRRTDEAITATAWIAPIHFPDDGLDRLGVGYNLLLARDDFGGDVWHVTRRRLLDLATSRSLVALVKREIAEPPEPTPRWPKYVAERRFWKELIELAEVDRGVTNALSDMTNAVRTEAAAEYDDASLRLVRALRSATLSATSRAFFDDFDDESAAAAMIGYVAYCDLLLRANSPG